MASYGMAVYDPSGNLVFDTLKKGLVLIDIFDVADGSGASRTYNAYSGRTLYAVLSLSSSADYYLETPHYITVSGLTVTVVHDTTPSYGAAMPDGEQPVTSKIYVFVR